MEPDPIAIWFVELPGGDWFAELDRGGVLRSRFRRYRDEKAFGSSDEKIWHEARGTPDELIRICRRFIDQLPVRGNYWELLRGDKTLDQFQAELLQLPFVHAKKPVKHLPGAPPNPKDGEIFIKNGISYLWIASEQVWAFDLQ